MPSTDIVWDETRYDSGLYQCTVVRAGDMGKLTVTLLGTFNHLLHRETVKCDRADTDQWRRHCEEVISKPELRNIEADR